MDTTIRNIDPKAYQALKARAALQGKNIGEVLTEAIWVYLRRAGANPQQPSILELGPESYPEGCEALSEQVDAVLYGTGAKRPR